MIKGPFRRVLRKNPKTGKPRYVIESMFPASIGKRAVNNAVADIGTTESPAGSNSQKYGEHWGENNVAWCGLALAKWWEQAGFEVPRSLALEIDYVPRLLTLALNKRYGMFIVGKNRVRPGDAAAYEFDGDKTADHVGVFEKWVDKNTGVFTAIEGNTSAAGSQSNGGAVLRKTRSINQVAGFVRKGK